MLTNCYSQGRPSNALAYFSTMNYNCPSQYNPADYVMDLVNQDMKIREELKEAYLQHRIISGQIPSQLSESSRYLMAEPSGKESDLTNPDKVNLIPDGRDGKWPIGFLPQMLILYSRSFRLTGKAQFTPLNLLQSIALAVISGLCWLRMEFREDTIPDRSSFIFFLMTFCP